MHAAIVNTWGSTPIYQTLSLPPPTPSQVRIQVFATAVHTLVRSRAAGKHFSVASKLPPHVPGTDGVGTISGTNQLVYFNALGSATGSLADAINVTKQDVQPLSAAADPDNIAVLVNPAMSSWMALTARAGIAPGTEFKVAIVGATGVSGQTAVQIAKSMGATEVVAIGKPGAKLDRARELGATGVIELRADAKETDWSAAGDVDVVLDYLWGDVAATALPGIIAKRKNKSQRLTWVEIGALGGEELAVSASLLRSANVALVGCAPGSWTFAELNEQLPSMLKAIVDGGLTTDYVVKDLKDVESWWDEIIVLVKAIIIVIVRIVIFVLLVFIIVILIVIFITTVIPKLVFLPLHLFLTKFNRVMWQSTKT
ncbi:zinc-containing alcohol dehydrogenase [Polyplosphaeria fusca]|uniref:Zinc-containing alcohol dehydrogenase n=1 Tax=Polyplosphaeria fusca TaxID=682080 RepID=A0A9P4QPT8_9PLEO|nr:zinc-containing alcohol dehydrogenase [Polyplosphaeria fusca]